MRVNDGDFNERMRSWSTQYLRLSGNLHRVVARSRKPPSRRSTCTTQFLLRYLIIKWMGGTDRAFGVLELHLFTRNDNKWKRRKASRFVDAFPVSTNWCHTVCPMRSGFPYHLFMIIMRYVKSQYIFVYCSFVISPIINICETIYWTQHSFSNLCKKSVQFILS